MTRTQHGILISLILYLSFPESYVRCQSCANEAQNLKEDVRIGISLTHDGASSELQAAVSQLNAVIDKAEQSKLALEAAIATAKSLRHQLNAPKAYGESINAVTEHRQQAVHREQFDLTGKLYKQV